MPPATLRFELLDWPTDASNVVEFLTANEWPFHGLPRLSTTDAADVTVVEDDIVTYWVREGDDAIGMIRLLDLDDVDSGSPLFDLRIAERHRGRGIGRQCVQWLTRHLFTTYPGLHRIEATTRADNVAMQSVFNRCHYRLEGRMLEAWKNADGTRDDSLVYAILRREHTSRN
jgi:RimJ/RimL family protein N-acetyltransferase